MRRTLRLVASWIPKIFQPHIQPHYSQGVNFQQAERVKRPRGREGKIGVYRNIHYHRFTTLSLIWSKFDENVGPSISKCRQLKWPGEQLQGKFVRTGTPISFGGKLWLAISTTVGSLQLRLDTGPGNFPGVKVSLGEAFRHPIYPDIHTSGCLLTKGTNALKGRHTGQ